ncbi:MAG: hypothetical protein HUJ30_01380 [Gammaproteobacteria bacterium]|nr:hypothetical protein [Gammaproteobacteria bacterium]
MFSEFRIIERNIIELSFINGLDISQDILQSAYDHIAAHVQVPYYLIINRCHRSISYQYKAIEKLVNHPKIIAYATLLDADNHIVLMSKTIAPRYLAIARSLTNIS